MRTITIPPMTAPATIPPIGVEDEEGGAAVDVVSGKGKLLVELGDVVVELG